MEDKDIRIQNLGNNDWCLTIIFPTEREAIEFEKKAFSTTLHITLKENNLMLLFAFDNLDERELLTAEINTTKSGLIRNKCVNHFSVAWLEMNQLTDNRCFLIPVEYHL